MLFLIDYENVHSEGMQGCGLLTGKDRVVLFYSAAACHMERRYLDQIEQSGCGFEIVQLVKTGKNALDFYIASHLGKLYGEGYRGKIVIVSKDSGFAAIRDYWTKCIKGGCQVYLSPSIEMGMLNAAGDLERVRELKNMKQSLDIKAFYQDYQKRAKLRHALEEKFRGTEYEAEIVMIQRMLGKCNNLKSLYLESLKGFGRKKGLLLYNILKTHAHPLLQNSH